MPAQRDRSGWPRWKEVLTERFLTRTRDDWCRILEGTDACFAPVLSMAEAHTHPHNQARGAFIDVGGDPPTGSRAPLRNDEAGNAAASGIRAAGGITGGLEPDVR